MQSNCFSTVYLETQRVGKPLLIIFRHSAVPCGPVAVLHCVYGISVDLNQGQVVKDEVFLWCVFVRASLHMRRQEKPTKCHWMFYCTYNMLNMFRALLCPSSGARDYMCVIVWSVWLLVVGVGAGQQAVRPERGMLHVRSLHCTP